MSADWTSIETSLLKMSSLRSLKSRLVKLYINYYINNFSGVLLFLGTVTSSIAKYTYFQTGEYLGEQVKLLPGTEAESIDK